MYVSASAVLGVLVADGTDGLSTAFNGSTSVERRNRIGAVRFLCSVKYQSPWLVACNEAFEPHHRVDVFLLFVCSLMAAGGCS